MTAAVQSKSAAVPPRPKRASTAASVKPEQRGPSKEQPTKRPIVKQEPKDVEKEKEDAEVGALICMTISEHTMPCNLYCPPIFPIP